MYIRTPEAVPMAGLPLAPRGYQLSLFSTDAFHLAIDSFHAAVSFLCSIFFIVSSYY